MKGIKMILDPTTPIGKVRLRVGDYSDLPYFEDNVYQVVLDDNSGDVVKSSVTMATYILATLTGQVHQKLAQIEVFGQQYFDNYLAFIKATILNPTLMPYIPLPYTPMTLDACGNPVEVPLIQFQKDWTNNYVCGTQSQDMHRTAYPVYPDFVGSCDCSGNYF